MRVAGADDVLIADALSAEKSGRQSRRDSKGAEHHRERRRELLAVAHSGDKKKLRQRVASIAVRRKAVAVVRLEEALNVVRGVDRLAVGPHYALGKSDDAWIQRSGKLQIFGSVTRGRKHAASRKLLGAVRLVGVSRCGLVDPNLLSAQLDEQSRAGAFDGPRRRRGKHRRPLQREDGAGAVAGKKLHPLVDGRSSGRAASDLSPD